MAPTLEGLNPTNMSNLDVLGDISFSIIDTDGTPTSSILAWVKYASRSDKVLVYDSVDFSFPFESNSTLLKPLGDDSNQSFSIVPEGGWEAAVEELRVEFFDNGAGGGDAATFENLSPPAEDILIPNFGLGTTISFDVVTPSDLAQVAVFVRFADSQEKIVIYETDGFTEDFVDFCTISGSGATRTFSLLENGGAWRARPVELFVYAEDDTGTTSVQEVFRFEEPVVAQGIPESQFLRTDALGQATRLRANLSARMAVLGTTMTISGFAIYQDSTPATLRTLASVWRFNPGGGVDLGWIFSLNSAGDLEWRWTTDGTIGTQTAISSSAPVTGLIEGFRWFHFGLAVDGTDARFYINGVPLGVPVVTGSTPFVSGVGDFNVGSDDDGTTRWAGCFGHTAFFDSKKDAAWFLANWNVIQDSNNPDVDRVASYIWEKNLVDINGTLQDLTIEAAATLTDIPPLVFS